MPEAGEVWWVYKLHEDEAELGRVETRQREGKPPERIQFFAVPSKERPGVVIGSFGTNRHLVWLGGHKPPPCEYMWVEISDGRVTHLPCRRRDLALINARRLFWRGPDSTVGSLVFRDLQSLAHRILAGMPTGS